MSYRLVYDKAFKQYELKCRHGKCYLDLLPTDPDNLVWGTSVSKWGIIRVNKDWAFKNPCEIHSLTKIEFEYKKPRIETGMQPLRKRDE